MISAVESKKDDKEETCQFEISVKPPHSLSDLNILGDKVGYFIILTKQMDQRTNGYRPFYKTEC